ncbi:hypothetical protein Sste5346_000066 [Sporothrix stenoceras]|uniref:NADAR domain-containing protein n=1 Tax=Sporothrix stenoceras TaxID=5173 RepID=A0ABR3ZSL4_9PEZI
MSNIQQQAQPTQEPAPAAPAAPRRFDEIPGAPVNHDEPIFFYNQDRPYGEFSQWARSTFSVSKTRIAEITQTDSPQDIAGPQELLTFRYAEQFMMFCKAVRFGDRACQQLILDTPEPAKQKVLGQRVRNFTEEGWDAVKSSVVEAASYYKCQQSPKLKRKLLETGDKLLVEAAARDRIWGIGYPQSTALKYRDTWGENRLGWALMHARAVLRADEEK